MIRVIFGYYNQTNPLFGFHNGDIINATNILPDEIHCFTKNLIGMINENGVFNFYIGNNSNLIKNIADEISTDVNLQ